jgi:hypothetical protein
MDTKSIDKRLSNEKYYFGTFARHRIPKAKLKSHGALIVNTNPSSNHFNNCQCSFNVNAIFLIKK